jgi:flavin-dependent dehydrogenase
MIQTTVSPFENQPPIDDRYDVIVVGAGPAGGATAALIAAAGRKVLLLDRAAFPRFHVGESLIPETYWTLDRLGLIPRLKASEFPLKYSVQFVSEGMKESAPFYFEEYNPHESSVTWQVERGRFDQMLTENAVTKGVTFRNDAQVLDVLFEGERATGVKLKFLTGETPPRELACDVLVDATGQSAFLATRLGLKEVDPNLRKATIWTYWRNALRDPGKDAGATIILQTPEKKSWFWYIPLPDNIVSIGCTGDTDYIFDKSRGSAEEVYGQELARCPALERRLAEAERVADYFVTKDYSFQVRQSAGPGWILVGDAGGFIDPVYSSGVFLALKSAEFVADAVIEAFEKQDFSRKQLEGWRPVYQAGVENFRRLVYAFYAPDFSFGTFLKKHPEFKMNMVDILIGDVFKEGVGDIFGAMAPYLEAPSGT